MSFKIELDKRIVSVPTDELKRMLVQLDLYKESILNEMAARVENKMVYRFDYKTEPYQFETYEEAVASANNIDDTNWLAYQIYPVYY